MTTNAEKAWCVNAVNKIVLLSMHCDVGGPFIRLLVGAKRETGVRWELWARLLYFFAPTKRMVEEKLLPVKSFWSTWPDQYFHTCPSVRPFQHSKLEKQTNLQMEIIHKASAGRVSVHPSIVTWCVTNLNLLGWPSGSFFILFSFPLFPRNYFPHTLN